MVHFPHRVDRRWKSEILSFVVRLIINPHFLCVLNKQAISRLFQLGLTTTWAYLANQLGRDSLKYLVQVQLISIGL